MIKQTCSCFGIYLKNLRFSSEIGAVFNQSRWLMLKYLVDSNDSQQH